MFPMQNMGGQSAQAADRKSRFDQYMPAQHYGRVPTSDYGLTHQSSVPYPAASLLPEPRTTQSVTRTSYPGQRVQSPTNLTGLLKPPYNYPGPLNSSISPSEARPSSAYQGQSPEKYAYSGIASERSQSRGAYESPERSKYLSPAEKAQRDLRLKQHCEALLKSSTPLTTEDLMQLYATLQQTADVTLSAEVEMLINILLQQKGGLNLSTTSARSIGSRQSDNRAPREPSPGVSHERRDPYDVKGSHSHYSSKSVDSKTSYPSKDSTQEAYKKTNSKPTYSEKYKKDSGDTRQATKSPPSADLDSLSGAVVSLGVEVHGLKKQLQTKTEECTKLTEMTVKLHTRISELEAQLLEEKRQKIDTNKSEAAKISELEDKLKKLMMIKDGFVTQVKCMSQALKEEKEKVTKFQASNAHMEVQQKQHVLQIDMLKEKITKLEAEIVKLNLHEFARISQIDALTKFGNAEKQKYAKIESQLSLISVNHGKRVDELNRSYLSAREKCLALQIENAKLKYEDNQSKKTSSLIEEKTDEKPNNKEMMPENKNEPEKQIETIESPEDSFIEQPEAQPDHKKSSNENLSTNTPIQDSQKQEHSEKMDDKKSSSETLSTSAPVQQSEKQEPSGKAVDKKIVSENVSTSTPIQQSQKQEAPVKPDQKKEVGSMSQISATFIQDGSQVPEVSSTGSNEQVSDNNAKKRKLSTDEEPQAKKQCSSSQDAKLAPELLLYSDNKTMANWLQPDVTKLSKVYEENPEHYYKIITAAKEYYKTFFLGNDATSPVMTDEKRKFIVLKLIGLKNLINTYDDEYLEQILLELLRFCMLLNWNSATNWRTFYSVEKASVGLCKSIWNQYQTWKEVKIVDENAPSKDDTDDKISSQTTESKSEESAAKPKTEVKLKVDQPAKAIAEPKSVADQPVKEDAAVKNENLDKEDEKATSSANSDSSDDVIFVGEVDHEANMSYELSDLQLDIEM